MHPHPNVLLGHVSPLQCPLSSGSAQGTGATSQEIAKMSAAANGFSNLPQFKSMLAKNVFESGHVLGM